jgi:trigger factor
MNISHSSVENLTSLLTVVVEQNDIAPKVETALKEYRKKVEIPGFRKGMAPIGLIKKKYEAPLKYEEINKIIQDSVGKYIDENKLDLISAPLPIEIEELDLDAEQIEFQFKLGFNPELSFDLSQIEVPYYNITASEKSVDDAINQLKKQFGTSEPQDIIDENSEIRINVVFENDQPKKPLFITSEMLKNPSLLIGKKLNEEVKISSNEFLIDQERTKSVFGFSDENQSGDFTIEIIEINSTKEAELNEELYKKAYPNEEILTETDLRNRIKLESEEYYKESSRIYFYNKATEKLVEVIDCPLPESFIIESIKRNAEKETSNQSAEEEFANHKNGYKYQIIENQIFKTNNITFNFDELKEYIRKSTIEQLAKYGMTHLTDEQTEEFINYSLKNKEQVQRYSQELSREKLIEVLKNNLKVKQETVTIDEFQDLIK